MASINQAVAALLQAASTLLGTDASAADDAPEGQEVQEGQDKALQEAAPVQQAAQLQEAQPAPAQQQKVAPAGPPAAVTTPVLTGEAVNAMSADAINDNWQNIMAQLRQEGI